jgi:tetratricopeptide (TPR) repeat protein
MARAAGTKRGYLSAIEKGAKLPRPATLGRLAEALGVTVREVDALAGLLGLAPEILDRTADPGALQALARVVRWAGFLRSAEAALLPFPRHLSAESTQPRNTPDAEADRQAAELWARLRPYTPAERRAIVQEAEEFQVWALSRLLCDVSIEAAADEPAAALELARLAELTASLVAGSDAWRSRLSGYGAFHVSSATRAGGSLPAAGEALERAETLWNAGAEGDPGERLAKARVLGLKASLRRAERHLAEALDLLDEALVSDRGGLRAHLLINRANTLEEMGRYEDAIATLYLASPHIDADREPRLLWAQRFNLSVNLCRLGLFAEADRLLEELLVLGRRVARGANEVRQAWLHGWIAAGMGRLEEAETALAAVREEFLARENGYDVALASLDLAKLYLQQGRTAEVKTLAGQMVVIFREQGVHREALAAVRLFQEAAEREQASIELVSRLADFLRRARHDAELRFTG